MHGPNSALFLIDRRSGSGISRYPDSYRNQLPDGPEVRLFSRWPKSRYPLYVKHHLYCIHSLNIDLIEQKWWKPLAGNKLKKYFLRLLLINADNFTWITDNNENRVRAVIYERWYHSFVYLRISLHQIKPSFALNGSYTRGNDYDLRIVRYAEIYRGNALKYV